MTALVSRLKAARLVWPTVFTLAGVLILIGLGRWQLERMTWKDGLIAEIGTRIHAAPVDGAEAERRVQHGNGEYTRVQARGQFLNGKELYFYFPDARLGPGFHVVTPLRLDDGRVVFVNRGFVPEAMKHLKGRQSGVIDGETTVTGLVRVPGQAGLFTPNNNPKTNLWFWPDLDAMTEAAFAREGAPAVLPFIVDAEAGPDANVWPHGGTTRLDLPNNHLQYALTWFGLAAALAAVFMVFVGGRLSRSHRPV